MGKKQTNWEPDIKKAMRGARSEGMSESPGMDAQAPERYAKVGRTARDAVKKKGILGKLIFLAILAMVGLLIFDQFAGNGEVIRNILNALGK